MSDGTLDTPIDWIPGMRNIQLKDLPSFLRTTDPNDIMFDFLGEEAQNCLNSPAIIFNTFDGFEQEVLEAISSRFPNIYTVGPLSLLCKQLRLLVTVTMSTRVRRGLAQLLHSRGFFITYVNTEFNHKRLVRSRGPEYVEGYVDESFTSDGSLDTQIDWIPGMRNIRLKDIPSFIRTTDPEDILLNYLKEEAQNCLKSSAIIINTFDTLEDEVLQAISSKFPHINTLGNPLQTEKLYE
ncbi:hypothetical protein C3L33_01889, partial [Rhododendron williamsianum]